MIRYHGSTTDRRALRAEMRGYSEKISTNGHTYSRRQRRAVDIVITTYTYFERESTQDDRKFLRSLPAQGRDRDTWLSFNSSLSSINSGSPLALR